LFARLNRNGDPLPKALHTNQVALIFKDAARRAGLPESEVARIAGHSTRIGATHELSRYGRAAGVDARRRMDLAPDAFEGVWPRHVRRSQTLTTTV
jgi:hypothetical protein